MGWKEVKLHGTQTARCMACKTLLGWKEAKLHGTQTAFLG